jgi:hypothetical protein
MTTLQIALAVAAIIYALAVHFLAWIGGSVLMVSISSERKGRREQ